DLAAEPLPVDPVGVAAVARAAVEGDEAPGLDLDDQLLAGLVGGGDGGADRVAGARRVADGDAGPPELLDAAVGPHPHGVVERPVPVAVLLDDDHDGEAVEAQRGVGPEEAPLRVGLGGPPSRRLWLADGPDAPRPVARPEPHVGRDLPLA